MKMNLQDLVEEVHRFDANRIVIEMSNGCVIAYEKQLSLKTSGKQEITFALLSPDEQYTRTTQHNLDSASFMGFSERMALLLDDCAPVFALQKKFEELEDRISKVYDAMILTLDIQPYRYRQLKDKAMVAGVYSLLTALWPVACPLFLVASLLKPSSNPAPIGAACVLAPVFFAQSLAEAVKEIFVPSGKAYKVANSDALNMQQTEEDAALVLNTDGTTKSFVWHSLAFRDGVVIHRDNNRILEYGKENTKTQVQFHDNAIMYDNAKLYVHINPAIKQKLYSAIQEREAEIEHWKEFRKKLDVENQSALLKSIGFIGGDSL